MLGEHGHVCCCGCPKGKHSPAKAVGESHHEHTQRQMCDRGAVLPFGLVQYIQHNTLKNNSEVNHRGKNQHVTFLCHSASHCEDYLSVQNIL